MQSDVFGVHGFERMDSSMDHESDIAAAIEKYLKNEAVHRKGTGNDEKHICRSR